jgi:SAM-dependent methyltransferase
MYPQDQAIDPTEQAFSSIYRHGSWHQTVRSGEGSIPSRTRRYVALLQRFIREGAIRSVVDLGCGDWSFSQYIDWLGLGVDYTGIDIVPELIASLNARFARPGVRFIQGNFLNCELPKADLAVSKEVLQHLPNAMVSRFLSRLYQFRYALLTNDRIKYEPRTWWNFLRPVETPRAANSDITTGDWRPLRLRDAPFELKARELARIRIWHSNGVHVKEVLVWESRPRADDATAADVRG